MENIKEIAPRVVQSIGKTRTTPAEEPTLKLNSDACECRRVKGTPAWCADGYVFRSAGNDGCRIVVPCTCTEIRRETKMLECVPKRYRTADLAHFPDKLYAAILAWLEKPNDGLYIGGPTGSGKTHLAAAILIAWRRRMKRGIWRAAAELYSLVRESYALKIEQSERDLVREHSEIPLLVLDDVGATGLSDHERRLTLEVVDRRLNEMRPTIVTSNWSVTELGQKMDDRIGSRLSAYTTVTLKGADRRLR